MSDRILLESGTNEVEIIEFLLKGQPFGVNVAKVREIIPYNPAGVTRAPESFHSVMGMFILRDITIPIIDLGRHLLVSSSNGDQDDDEKQVVMVCEFNDMVNGFLVDGVTQIRRCSWHDISPLSSYISRYRPSVTSSIYVDGHNILMIDLEHIISDIYPERSPSSDLIDIEIKSDEDLVKLRNKKKIVFAEDSAIVRASVEKVLKKSGYVSVEYFDNGGSAYERIEEYLKKSADDHLPLSKYVDALVTDIEMPRMDGLTICRILKEDKGLKDFPIIIFSSLVNPQMKLKCQKVGADDYSNKLNLDALVLMLDKHIFKAEK